MVRVDIKGWFTTYKNLKSGERAEYHYHRATGMRLNGKPGSPEFIADYAAAEKLIRDRLAGTFNGLGARLHAFCRVRRISSPQAPRPNIGACSQRRKPSSATCRSPRSTIRGCARTS